MINLQNLKNTIVRGKKLKGRADRSGCRTRVT